MHRSVYILLLAAACSPQNAELTSGNYVAFLADSNSLTLSKERVKLDGFDSSYTVDCREFATPADKDALQLDNPLPICGGNKWPPVYEQWAGQDGFYVVSESLEPWRGEALMTSEGDLQIAFHQTVPGSQDFRFVFTIDPDFSPVTCETNGDSFDHTLKDGDWVTEWSKELEYIGSQDDAYRAAYPELEGLYDGRMYFVNAYGYQLNPQKTTDYWSLPDYWVSGASQGKFVEEAFGHRSPRYGEPSVYNSFDASSSSQVAVSAGDLWWCDMEEGEDPSENACFGDLETHIRDVSATMRKELNLVMTPEGADAPLLDMMPIVHMNDWRAPDGRPPGFDGWGELHYNYVVFDKSSVLEAGGSASGAFAFVYDAEESSSRFFVKGTFDIPRIKNDHWVTPNLEHDKLVENDVQLCDAASWYDANLPGPIQAGPVQ